ncbi:TPA: replication/maintenance protein RepL [Escherichia coli]
MSVERYKSNPFLENMIVPVKGRQVKLSRLGKDNNILMNQSTGEFLGTHVTTYKQVDADQFIKIFTDNIAMTFDFTSAGIKAFGVLLWAVQHHALSKDEVDLDSFILDAFISENNKENNKIRLSMATFKRGINELEKASIIAKTLRKGRYYINPNFVFNGDRIAFTNLIERKAKDK